MCLQCGPATVSPRRGPIVHRMADLAGEIHEDLDRGRLRSRVRGANIVLLALGYGADIESPGPFAGDDAGSIQGGDAAPAPEPSPPVAEGRA